jgi:hypothetical protein
MTRRIADLLLAEYLEPSPDVSGEVALSEQPTAALQDADLRDKVGAYRIQSTGQIWRITRKDGTLYVTDHRLKTHALRSLSATRFDPQGPFYSSTQFVFSQQPGDKRPSHISLWMCVCRGRAEFSVFSENDQGDVVALSADYFRVSGVQFEMR